MQALFMIFGVPLIFGLAAGYFLATPALLVVSGVAAILVVINYRGASTSTTYSGGMGPLLLICWFAIFLFVIWITAGIVRWSTPDWHFSWAPLKDFLFR